MQKRTIIFGSYNTAERGWTLTGLHLSDPEQKTNYVEKSGGDGSWDLSTAQTEGIPRYKNRTLTVTLECSKGTRDEREELLNEMVNTLDGLEWKIVLPDRPNHYLVGRLHIAVNYSDPAHAKVTVTGNVEPWLYSSKESVVELESKGVGGTARIYNRGRKVVVPILTVDGAIQINFGSASVRLGEGAYKWAPLVLAPGFTTISYSGVGSLMLTFREAVLR